MPFNIQGPELILILIIALIVIGPGKLPDVGSALGKSIREFRKAASDVQDVTKVDVSPLPATPVAAQAAQAAPQAAPTPAPTAEVAEPAAAPPVAPAANVLSEQAAPNEIQAGPRA